MLYRCPPRCTWSRHRKANSTEFLLWINSSHWLGTKNFLEVHTGPRPPWNCPDKMGFLSCNCPWLDMAEKRNDILKSKTITIIMITPRHKKPKSNQTENQQQTQARVRSDYYRQLGRAVSADGAHVGAVPAKGTSISDCKREGILQKSIQNISSSIWSLRL